MFAVLTAEMASHGITINNQLILDGLPTRTSRNDIRRFGAASKVKVNQQMHRALAIFPSAEAAYEIMPSGPLRPKGVNLLTHIPRASEQMPGAT
ncbi:hypothetical protein TcWFU_004707 [Taenia crassiceps]|uniref:Uncharacterized protein n=1 Tax=Taenia crassiceps TaxID=6207 RepID=A0ABR4QL42_9CEST